ncbi:Spy/CpxP family protein refolding chaperone [Plebeiibacterium sediminum]|uniref:Spy/CpxP family protein refolding chaperone n=1 Tax=Plebeiibacterium sediminum TaxID=2992112 RepID=A0AAE3M7X2_9BACT|nr:Spy/CpxP family protein refolding chaperone [Plebeiobacterium sediminum]MCW3788647.1 Spy/CpxP family protein refolding chaperone [Plebeiobacterium sediminum]
MRKANYLKKMVLFTVIMVSLSATAWCQMPERNRMAEIEGDRHHQGLNLTEDQKDQMKTFRVEFLKELTPLKNEVKIKNAQLQAASVGNDINEKQVYKLIEEIGGLKTQIAKKHFDHKQKVRNILTEEQKVLFDAKPQGKGLKGRQQGMDAGREMMNQSLHKGNRGKHFKSCMQEGERKHFDDDAEKQIIE